MQSNPRQWDIFCSVVDNYGDIGVTWRLARQLVDEFGQHVCLWVDDLVSFARICPELQPEQSRQICRGVEIAHWTDEFPESWQPGNIVIEAFACELPALARQRMSQHTPAPLWLNLEYLSAESWIDECHGLPSLQHNGLNKFFFFPGFTLLSGGLICEHSLAAQRQSWQAVATQRQQWMARFGLPLQPEDTRYISLFTYESAALPALLSHWRDGSSPVCCLIPKGRILNSLAPWLGQPLDQLGAGYYWQQGSLTILILPMTDQPEYDHLLWNCDFNLVRGEDSFLRAQWAARPFLWHIYPQADAAHLEKLTAFLELYGQNLSPDCHNALNSLSLAYDQGLGIEAVNAWKTLDQYRDELLAHAQSWPQQALAGGDLASRLVQFSEKRLK
jgi:uncharacterized repeat protein (TIGR03837 family)